MSEFLQRFLDDLLATKLLAHLAEDQYALKQRHEPEQVDDYVLVGLLQQWGIYINLLQHDQKDAEGYIRFFEALTNLNPDVFDAVNITAASDEHEGMLSFELDSRTYEKRYYPSIGIQNAGYLLALANRALADQEFQERFIEVLVPIEKSLPSPVVNYAFGKSTYRVGGVVCLNPSQRRVMEKYLRLNSSRHADHIWTTAAIESLVQTLSEIGVLGDRSGNEVEQGLRRVLQETDGGFPIDVFEVFEGIASWFDTEGFDGPRVYVELLREASAISQGIVNLLNITAEIESEYKEVTVAFDLNAKHYSARIPVDRDWISLLYLRILNAALEDNEIEGQYCLLYRPAQDVIVLFLNYRQIEEIGRRNLFSIVQPVRSRWFR